MSPAATGRIFRHVRQRRRRAGNRRCQRAVERPARHRVTGGVEIHLLRRRERRALARVHHRFKTVGFAMQQPESTAAEAGAVGFHHRERRGHGDRGIEGVAAARKNFMAGGGGQRMRAGDGDVGKTRRLGPCNRHP